MSTPDVVLNIWAVYQQPTDFPDLFVARRYELEQPTSDIRTGSTLEEVRAALPPGLYRLDRHEKDDPKIVEVWI